MTVAVPEPQDHTGGRTQSTQRHMPSCKAHPSYTTDDCSHGLSTVIHCHTRCSQAPGHSCTQTHTITQSTYTARHTLSHGHTAADMHCHTQTHRDYPFFCSLGRKGTPEVMVSILLPLDTTASLGPDRCGF